MQNPILVFDIETVPDIETGKRLYTELKDLSDDDALVALTAIREAEAGNAFMRLPLHKVVCLSFLWADLKNDKFSLKSLALNEYSEKEILSTFLGLLINRQCPFWCRGMARALTFPSYCIGQCTTNCPPQNYLPTQAKTVISADMAI